MGISDIGRWIIVAVGVAFLATALVLIVKDAQRKWGLVVLLIFGTLFLGIGVFGPGFLKDYSDFIKSIGAVLEMEKSATPATYGAVFNKIAKGELPASYQELALAYAIDRPGKNMQQLLDEAISKATDTSGKAALENARADLAGKQFAAEQIAASLEAARRVSTGELEKLDSTT